MPCHGAKPLSSAHMGWLLAAITGMMCAPIRADEPTSPTAVERTAGGNDDLMTRSRLWTDRKRQLSVEARLIDVRVLLQRTDGVVFSIPMSQLSLADKRYLMSQPSTAVEAHSATPLGLQQSATGAETRMAASKPAVVPRKLTSYLHATSSAGDSILQGQELQYSGDELILGVIQGTGTAAHGIQIRVDGWRLTFAANAGEHLEVRKYPDAVRYPFNSDICGGIDFSGHGRGCSKVSGEFEVKELEIDGNQVLRIAVDFQQRCEGTMPPISGKLRFNSTLP